MSFGTKKLLLTSLGTTSLLSWFLFIYLYFFRWQNVAPIEPSPATGQIYRVNYHGYVFYLTKQQELAAYIFCGLAVVTFVAAAFLETRWKVYERIYGKFRRPLL
jgi:hypothetical protein